MKLMGKEKISDTKAKILIAITLKGIMVLII